MSTKEEIIECRSNVRKVFKEIFPEDWIYINMEKGIYNSTISNCKQRNECCNPTLQWSRMFLLTYQQIFKKVYSNTCGYIDNPALLDKIRNKEILPHKLAFMTAKELFPEKWAQLVEDQQKRAEALSELQVGKTTDQYKCGRCGNRKCTYYELQIRSADEPMTIFITCTNCGNQWKD